MELGRSGQAFPPTSQRLNQARPPQNHLRRQNTAATPGSALSSLFSITFTFTFSVAFPFPPPLRRPRLRGERMDLHQKENRTPHPHSASPSSASPEPSCLPSIRLLDDSLAIILRHDHQATATEAHGPTRDGNHHDCTSTLFRIQGGARPTWRAYLAPLHQGRETDMGGDSPTWGDNRTAGDRATEAITTVTFQHSYIRAGLS